MVLSSVLSPGYSLCGVSCSLSVCMGFLQVVRFPPIPQNVLVGVLVHLNLPLDVN